MRRQKNFEKNFLSLLQPNVRDEKVETYNMKVFIYHGPDLGPVQRFSDCKLKPAKYYNEVK